jgi:hypothetical protein
MIKRYLAGLVLRDSQVTRVVDRRQPRRRERAERSPDWMTTRRLAHARTGTGLDGAWGWNGRISAWSGPTMP